MFGNQRFDYPGTPLELSDLNKNPLEQFRAWWQDAIHANVALLDGVCLSTVDDNNAPNSRMVLLKAFDEQGFIFFTNYESTKARELSLNPHASMVLFWPELFRQIRLRGVVNKSPREISKAYFNTRPRKAQIGAHVSQQSRHLKDRTLFEQDVASLEEKWANQPIECPTQWGGFTLVPTNYEFWQGRENRLHDRFCYTPLDDGKWQIERLYP